MDTERNPFKNITAEAPFDGLRVVSQVEPQRAQRIKFLFIGRRRQTKTLLKLELEVLPNRRLPIGQKGFPLRTLRLCGEISESLSALICVNLRLISEPFAPLPLDSPRGPEALEGRESLFIRFIQKQFQEKISNSFG